MCSRSSRQTSGGSTNFQQNMLDAGHRMVPTHATKAGMRYRYYASLPHLKGESKTTSVGSISRIPATDIEAIVVKSAKEHLGVQHGQSSASSTRQTCSMRQVNMTMSLAFLAPGLVQAAVQGQLPRGIGVERLRDAPPEWNEQFEMLGLNPEWVGHAPRICTRLVLGLPGPKISRGERNFPVQIPAAHNSQAGHLARRNGSTDHSLNSCGGMVGATGIEPVTPSMSTRCSPAELRALKP